MSHSTRIVFRGSLVVFGVILAWLMIANRRVDEPRYQGQRLRAWMDELTSEPRNPTESEVVAAKARQLQELTNVVRSVGVAALPCYLAWIQNAPRQGSSYEKLSDWLSQSSGNRVRLPERKSRVSDAVLAMQILGPDARPAVVSLERMLNAESSCGAAARCLTAIGSDSVPVITNALMTSGNNHVRYAAAWALGDLGAAARPARFALLGLIQNDKSCPSPGLSIADLALRAVAEMDLTAHEIVPLLGKQILATNAAAGAAYGLARLGVPATPFLLQALTNQNGRIRASAEAAFDLRKHLEAKGTNTPGLLFEYFNTEFNNRLLRVANGE